MTTQQVKLAEYEIIIFNIMSEIETALKRARDTKALEFGVGAMEKVPAMFEKLFPGKTAIVVETRILTLSQAKQSMDI